MCDSWHESCSSWHVQQQQRFRLEKENFCSNPHGKAKIYHEGRAELGAAQDSDKSFRGLELENIED